MVTIMVTPRVMRAGEFKAKCLEAMDEVAATGEPIILTKRGRPVARLMPVASRPTTLRGFLKGSIASRKGIVRPTGIRWTAAGS